MKVVSLFDGISCGRVALERAGIPVESYVAFEIDKHAIAISKKNYPDIAHCGSVVGFPFSLFEGYDLVIGGSPCFVAGTKVICKDAYKNIEDVRVGDEVLTHKNRYRKVLRIGNTVAPTYMVKAWGVCDIETTAEHPFYTRDRIKTGDKVIFSTPYWKSAADLLRKENRIASIKISEVSTNALSEDESYFLGAIFSGGYIKAKSDYMVISIPAANLSEFLKRIPAGVTLIGKPHQKCRRVKVILKISSRICDIWKRLCSFTFMDIQKGSLANRLAFLLGAIAATHHAGPSYQSSGVIYLYNDKEKLLFLRLLMSSTCGRLGELSQEYSGSRIAYHGRDPKRSKWCLAFDISEFKGHSRYYHDEDLIWSGVKSAEPTGNTKIVYNLEVEEDNTYTANNVVVHNCQGFSFAGKQLAFDDPRSQLFFEFVRAIREIKPKYFLLENVKMKKEHQDVITSMLGVDPIEINSSLLSAQNRRRLYWCNWKVEPPEDRGILLKDIIEDGVTDRDKSYCIDANYWKGGNLEQYFEKSRRQLVFNERKANCLRARCNNEVLSEKGVERVLGKTIGNMVFGAAQRGRYLVDGKRQDHKMKTAGLTEQRIEIGGEKSNTLTSVQKDSLVLENMTIRKLTPIECERLQTLPDNYTLGVSNSSRYKALGNGWTVDVIAHILKNLIDNKIE